MTNNITYPIIVEKNSELFKQIKFYINKNIYSEKEYKIKSIRIISNKCITYNIKKNKQCTIPIPFNEWSIGKIADYAEYRTDKSNLNKLCTYVQEIVDISNKEYEQVIHGIYVSFDKKQKSIIVRVEGVINCYSEIGYYELYNGESIDKMEVQKLFLKKLFHIIQKSCADTDEVKSSFIKNNKKHFMSIVLTEFQKQNSAIYSISEESLKNNDLLVNFFDEKFPIHIDGYGILKDYGEYVFEFNDYKCLHYLNSVKLTENSMTNIINKLVEKLNSEIDITIPENSNMYNKIQELLKHSNEYVKPLYTGICFRNTNNIKKIKYYCEDNNPTLIIKTQLFDILLNNKNVSYKNNSQFECDNCYRYSVDFIYNKLSPVLTNIKFVSGNGLLNGDTFIYICKDGEKIPFFMKSYSYKKDEWKNNITKVCEDVLKCFNNGKSNINQDFFYRCIYDNYGNFLDIDIIKFVQKNNHVTLDMLVQALRGLKFTSRRILNNIESSGLYKPLDSDYIEERCDTLIQNSFLNLDTIFYAYGITKKSHILLNSKVNPEFFNYLVDNNKPFNCLELKYLTNLETKSNKEWMWLLEQSFTNLEFLCICKDEVINCWSKADDMFVQLLKMKLDNNFFNIPFQKKIIKEIIKKQKLNKRLK